MIRGLTSAEEFGGSVEDGQWGKTSLMGTCQQAVTLGQRRDDEVDPGLKLWRGGWEDGTVMRYLRIAIRAFGGHLDEVGRRCESLFLPFTQIGNRGERVWGEMFLTSVLSACKIKSKFLSMAFKVLYDLALNSISKCISSV